MNTILAWLAGLFLKKEGIKKLLQFASSVLHRIDTDDEGWDDIAADILYRVSIILKAYEKKEYRLMIRELLEIAQLIAENLDKGYDGLDDDIAKKISDLKSKLYG